MSVSFSHVPHAADIFA